MRSQRQLERNDIRQYDDLAEHWWDAQGAFAMLHWIAAARSDLVPEACAKRALLVDLGCGAGLMAPYVAPKGYRHVGVDVTRSALMQAADKGVCVVNGDITRLPLPDGCADVVCAGEIYEHVTELPLAVAETCRILKPSGLVVIDTLARTRSARFVAVTLAERFRGGAPKGIHDPALFVDRNELVELFASHGVRLQLRGLRPSLRSMFMWRLGLSDRVQMVPTRSTRVLFQAWGTKAQ